MCKCDNIWVWSGDKHYLSKYQMVVVQNGYVRVGLVRLYEAGDCCKDCGETIEIFATGLRFFVDSNIYDLTRTRQLSALDRSCLLSQV